MKQQQGTRPSKRHRPARRSPLPLRGDGGVGFVTVSGLETLKLCAGGGVERIERALQPVAQDLVLTSQLDHSIDSSSAEAYSTDQIANLTTSVASASGNFKVRRAFVFAIPSDLLLIFGIAR